MKILEINKFYFSQGGADRHFLDVVKLLESQGNEVAVFAMRHAKNHATKWSKYFVSEVGYTDSYPLRQKIKGVLRMFYSLEARSKIKKILDDFQPELVHIHNIYHQISPSILAETAKRKIPVVMTVHDYKLICPDYLLNGENFGFWEFVRKKCFKNSYFKSFLAALEWHFHKKTGIYEKNIDLYIAPSLFVKNKLVEHGINGNKITVIPHFIAGNNTDFSSILPRIEEKCEKKNKKCFLYSGRIAKSKGVGVLIGIFKNIPGARLCLAGKKEDGFAIEESANIIYFGHLNQAKLKSETQKSVAVVSGSRLPETFGLAALEAIACGKPFIGFRTGAFPEIIQNGKNGYLCDDIKEFEKIILKFAKGEIVLNSRKIKELAWKKHNPENYCRQISDIFTSLTK